MIAFVFPGQGAQSKGMGQGLFDTVSEFRAVEKQIDALLGYSLRRLCLEDPDNRLGQTQYTQPALFVVNALHGLQALAREERPAFFAGHSLGEYNALHAAGAFDLLTGVRLVKKRGELMSQARGGMMAAIVGLPRERIAEILRSERFDRVDLANHNSPMQTVISGPDDDIQRAGAIFERAGAQLYVPLQVSAAFHSRYMGRAAAAFGEFLAQFSFAHLRTPVVANVTAQPYPQENSDAAIKLMLVKQMTHPVNWTESIRYLIGQGVAAFREVGPGNTLTRLVQQIRQQAA
jgi:malonyl CoA-acyl carrier protein transacylase